MMCQNHRYRQKLTIGSLLFKISPKPFCAKLIACTLKAGGRFMSTQLHSPAWVLQIKWLQVFPNAFCALNTSGFREKGG